MDLMQLAGASNPGQALPGMEWDQIRRYQNLNTINQSALQQAMPVAQSNAQRELQTNEEWNLAAPGRKDTITLGNMNAAQGVKDFDQVQASKKLEMALKDQKLKAEIQDFTKPLASYGDAFVNAKPEDQEAMLDELARSGMTLPDGSKFGVDRKKDRFMLDMTGKARAGNPTLQTKLEQERLKGNNRITIENMKNLSAREMTILRGEIQAKLQGDRIAAARAAQQGKPMTVSQALAAHLDAEYGDDHQKWLNAYRLVEEASTTLKIDEKAAMLRIFPQLADKLGAPAQPRELPPGKPKTQSDTSNTKKSDPVIDGIWDDGKTKRKIKDIGRDASGKAVQIKLEDGTIVDYK